ncbi:MAG TPA: hypothetical protein VGH58_07635 [Solirubrobacterales bacterium]
MLTFSNVVACIALFVALGGSVYAAGKISGTQIKSGSIPGNRIKSKSLTGKQIKPGSLTGTQIQAGSLGATQINQSTLTGVSASSLASVQYVSASAPISAISPTGTTATASCPAGTYVTGGGATVSNEELAGLNDSGPTAARTGWSATAFGESGTSVTVTAICTAVKAIG